MGRIRCADCGRWFHPNPRVPHQRYCSRVPCQRTRRRLWQKEKLATDEDYRLNQADAQRRWREAHRDYWREYRESHPEYSQRNRRLQGERNHIRRRHPIAKMDSLIPKTSFYSGTYQLVPVDLGGIAKMDALIVKIDLVSAA
jgi:hypothetical protein